MKTPSLILLNLVLSGMLLVPSARAADVAELAFTTRRPVLRERPAPAALAAV